MKKKLERYGTYGTIVFKSLFLILTLLSFCSFTAHRTWMSYFSVIVTIVGACVLLFRLTQFKSYYKTKYLVFLFIFTASYILTMFLNYKYGILESVKGLVWLSFQFFILYACDTNKSPDDYKKEFKLLAHIVIVYFLISIIISLFMFAMGYSLSLIHISRQRGPGILQVPQKPLQ